MHFSGWKSFQIKVSLFDNLIHDKQRTAPRRICFSCCCCIIILKYVTAACCIDLDFPVHCNMSCLYTWLVLNVGPLLSIAENQT